MRVLHIVHWARSGIGVVVRDLVRHRSADIEHVVLCLSPGRPTTDQMRADGAQVYEPSRAWGGWWKWAAELKHRVRYHSPEVLHSHSITPRVLAALNPQVPHVTTVHAAYAYFRAPGVRNGVKRMIECVAARRVAGPVVCVSEDVLRSLPCEAMAAKAMVIHNGIDLEAVRAASRGSVVTLKGDPLLVAAGRLEPEKGYDHLLVALDAVRNRYPGVRLVICGEGDERRRLEALAKRLGLDELVVFTGHVENPMPYLQAADAVVSSSISEGFGLTIAEALALGRPVVSTPSSGLPSLLSDGENAILAAGSGSEHIASAIVSAVSDRGRLQRVAEAGRRFAEQRLEVRSVVGGYEKIYRSLAGCTKT